MVEGSASTVINCSPSVVFDIVADVTRMGEWSPECTSGRWVEPATGPELGAKFEGDNEASLGPVTLKKWTTTSEVTGYVANELLEFVSAGYTTWRYEFESHDGTTRLTESFSHAPMEGWQRFVYGTLARRTPAMVKGMERTLDRIKVAAEA